MNSELFVKVSQREERVDRIKAFLIFPVATFHLAIMSGSVGANQFMLDTQLSGGFLKKGKMRLSALSFRKIRQPIRRLRRVFLYFPSP